MARRIRKIVQIDEDKCTGCGECVPACAEGAIRIIDGKARLVSDVYCDGLGACLGHCPEDAITIIEREAEDFDEEAAVAHVAESTEAGPAPGRRRVASATCPGAATRQFSLGVLPQAGGPTSARPAAPSSEGVPSALTHWPVQLNLVPPGAPFLKGADLLLVADCVPFAMADFHGRVLRGRPVVVGCPKLDDPRLYAEKLAAILSQAELRSLTVVCMEVPCCSMLMGIAEEARRSAGTDTPLKKVRVSLRGQMLEAEGEKGDAALFR